LLIEGELQDPAALLLSGEGGEDPLVEAEVGMAHVRAFDCAGKSECESAKSVDAC
jgi:hypothetical protein